MNQPDRLAADITLRPRRQLTLPAEVCEALGLRVGDHLEVTVEGNAMIVRPRKTLALEALREIQRAFAASGISEEELQAEGRRIREELSRARYGGA